MKSNIPPWLLMALEDWYGKGGFCFNCLNFFYLVLINAVMCYCFCPPPPTVNNHLISHGMCCRKVNLNKSDVFFFSFVNCLWLRGMPKFRFVTDKISAGCLIFLDCIIMKLYDTNLNLVNLVSNIQQLWNLISCLNIF